MTDDHDRMTGIETRLDSIEGDVKVLKADVGTLKADVGTLKADVGTLKADVGTLKTDTGTLTGEVHKLRLLYEHHDTQIQRMAEVQVEHGRLLVEIKDGLKPIKDLHDFVQRISDNHEARIAALEKHTGLS
jgi:archaellum component FlaC